MSLWERLIGKKEKTIEIPPGFQLPSPTVAELIREIYPSTEMNPEEYAGRFGHKARLYERFIEHGDPELQVWMDEANAIVSDFERYREAREKFLNEEERPEVLRYLKMRASNLRETYPIEELSAGEWVGRCSHKLNSLSFYASLPLEDEPLAAWFSEVKRLLSDEESVKSLRKEYLGPEESSRLEEEVEKTRKRLREKYPIETMSPEEYAARHTYLAHLYTPSDGPHFDKEIDEWFQDVERIQVRPSLLEHLREKYLSPEEREEVERKQRVALDDIRPMFEFSKTRVEEYAARYAHNMLVFSMGDLDYGNDEANTWLRKLKVIISNDKLLKRCRRQFLPTEERERIEYEVWQQSQPGYEW